MFQKLKKKLISLGTLDSNGCIYKARGGVLRISKSALIMMKRKKINGLYILQGSTVTGAIEVSTSESIIETTRLWYTRLGMSERGLIILSKQGLLDGQKNGRTTFFLAVCVRETIHGEIQCRCS